MTEERKAELIAKIDNVLGCIGFGILMGLIIGAGLFL